MPIYLSANGRLLADPPTPAACAVVARVGAALARVQPPLPTQPGAPYQGAYCAHARLLRRWVQSLPRPQVTS
jgi:hypothetical protein